jgi:thiol-disulfide isomerase/thioredoxin
MTATRSRSRAAQARAKAQNRDRESEGRGGINTNVVIGVALAVVAIVVAAIVVFAVAGSDDESGATNQVAPAGAVTVEGAALPGFTDAATDPAVGTPVPEITAPLLGNGTEVTWASTGRPRLLVFLAHWCPHCQDDVDNLTDWLEEGNTLPTDRVDVQSISTLVDEGRGNYPVSDWLEEQSWPYPTVIDDEANTLYSTFGGGGTPFWVFVDADGTVAGRHGGELDPEVIAGLMNNLADGTFTASS